MIAQSQFREDLYFRLSMVEIKLRRLADRKEALPPSQRHFLAKSAAEYKQSQRLLTRRAQPCSPAISWLGNVRELENVLGNVCMMAETDTLDVRDFPALPHHDGSVQAPVPTRR
jgi:two-component system response regulator GlrR